MWGSLLVFKKGGYKIKIQRQGEWVVGLSLLLSSPLFFITPIILLIVLSLKPQRRPYTLLEKPNITIKSGTNDLYL